MEISICVVASEVFPIPGEGQRNLLETALLNSGTRLAPGVCGVGGSADLHWPRVGVGGAHRSVLPPTTEWQCVALASSVCCPRAGWASAGPGSVLARRVHGAPAHACWCHSPGGLSWDTEEGPMAGRPGVGRVLGHRIGALGLSCVRGGCYQASALRGSRATRDPHSLSPCLSRPRGRHPCSDG